MNIENVLNIIGFVMIATWILLFIQSHRLFYLFRKKYPQVAKEKISNAFELYADPDKILFFFKTKNIPLLKKDSEIWNLRQQTKMLFLISIGLPITMVLVVILIIIKQQM